MMSTELTLVLLAEGVRIRHKSASRLMRLIGVFMGLFGMDFMGGFWTTAGPRTIWAPDRVNFVDLGMYETIIRHELVHIKQARRWPVLWQLSYLLLPLPLGLSWFRWRWEREAYLVDIRAGRMSVEQVVQSLWHHYGFAWPRPWMRRWFYRHGGVQ